MVLAKHEGPPNFNFYLSLEMHQMYFELSDPVTPQTLSLMISAYEFFIRITHNIETHVWI